MYLLYTVFYNYSCMYIANIRRMFRLDLLCNLCCIIFDWSFHITSYNWVTYLITIYLCYLFILFIWSSILDWCTLFILLFYSVFMSGLHKAASYSWSTNCISQQQPSGKQSSIAAELSDRRNWHSDWGSTDQWIVYDGSETPMSEHWQKLTPEM